MVISDQRRCQARSCSNANAPAAVREGDAELREDVLHVPRNRVLADHEDAGDLSVALAGRDQPQHLQLAWRQAVCVRGCGFSREGVHTGKIRSRAELFERTSRGLQLERERILVAELAAGLPDEHTHASRFVRSLELFPGLRGPAKIRERRRGVARRQLEGSVSVCVNRLQHRAVALGSDLLELSACQSRLVEIADRDQDLGVGRQQAGTFQPIGRLADRTTNCRGRCFGVSLRKAQQRPARLRLEPQLTRFAIRLLGLGELSSKTVNLTAEVAGLCSSGLVHAQRKTLACALRLFQCIPPIPAKVHQLSAMHEAAAGERDEVGLLPAPACQDGRPLLRAAQLVDSSHARITPQ